MAEIQIERKIVDIHEYMPVLKDILSQGRSVHFIVTGSSMSPFLSHERDSVIISPPGKTLKTGDIVFYQRDSGQYVMHRICKIKKDGLYLIGDGQTENEGPIRRDQVFGQIRTVFRNGKKITEGDLVWNFFSRIWIHIIPCRPFFIRMAAWFSRRPRRHIRSENNSMTE